MAPTRLSGVLRPLLATFLRSAIKVSDICATHSILKWSLKTKEESEINQRCRAEVVCLIRGFTLCAGLNKNSIVISLVRC